MVCSVCVVWVWSKKGVRELAETNTSTPTCPYTCMLDAVVIIIIFFIQLKGRGADAASIWEFQVFVSPKALHSTHMHTHLDMYSPSHHTLEKTLLWREEVQAWESDRQRSRKGAPWWCSPCWHKVPTHKYFYRSVQPSSPGGYSVQQSSPRRPQSTTVLSRSPGCPCDIVSEWPIVQVTWLIRPRTPVWPFVRTRKKSRLGRRLLHHQFTPCSKPFYPISGSLTFTPIWNSLAQDGA